MTTPADIASASQTPTTYLPPSSPQPHTQPTNPSNPHPLPSTLRPKPINDTGAGKRERRAGDRHEMWHEMQKWSPSDTHRPGRADISVFQPSLQCG